MIRTVLWLKLFVQSSITMWMVFEFLVREIIEWCLGYSTVTISSTSGLLAIWSNLGFSIVTFPNGHFGA